MGREKVKRQKHIHIRSTVFFRLLALASSSSGVGKILEKKAERRKRDQVGDATQKHIYNVFRKVFHS